MRLMSRHFHTFVQQLLVAAVFVSAGIPASAAEDDAQLEAVRAKIGAMFEMIDPENINPSPVDGWYTIQQGSIVVYVSNDGRYLMQGDLIDLDAQTNLTEAARAESRRELIDGLPDDETIVFAPPEIKHVVTVFTDVECTYCRKLHSQINDYLGYGIEVRYVLYPRNGPASRAWTTSEDVWCAKDRNGALTAAKSDQAFETTKCNTQIISEHYMLGQDVGLSGTPAIVLEDGTLISGYLPPDALNARLEQAGGQ
jgi:thiol:disulfide interchange protein DsbC